MGQLTNQFVSQSYQGLLNLENANTGVTATLQYVTDGVGNRLPMLASTSSVVITGSFRGDGSGLTGVTTTLPSGVVSGSVQIVDLGFATTSSLDTLSGSIAVTDLAQNNRLTSLEQFTGSIDTGYVSEAEFGTYTSSMNNFTSSIDSRVDALEIETGSLQNQINQKLDTGSFNTYTSSVNTKLAGLDIETGSLQNQINGLATTGSLSGYTTITAFNNYTSSNDTKVNNLTSKTGSYATTGSNQFNGNQSISGSVQASSTVTSLDGFVGGYFGSNVNNTLYGDQLVDIKTQTTGNNGKVRLYSNGNYPFRVQVTGSLDVTGTITATSASFTYVNTVYETASVIYSSGSNQFGDASNDTQTLFGTVNLPSGPLVITGSVTSTGGFTGSLQGTASNAISSSHAINADTASFVQNAISSSYATNAATASIAYDVVVYGKCDNPGGLTRGTVVRIVGADGNNPLFDSASWEDDFNSANTLGVLSEDVASNAFANIVVQGKLIGINTDGMTAGDMLYLSSSGQYTTSSVPAPYHEVRLGQVLRPQLNNGSMYVNIDNGYELQELHDVDISGVTAGDMLIYRSGSYGQWVNESISEIGLATTGSNTFTGQQNIETNLNVTQSLNVGGNSTFDGQTTYNDTIQYNADSFIKSGSQINFNIGDGQDGKFYRLSRKVGGEFGIVEDPGNYHLLDISSSFATLLPPTYFTSGAFATGSLQVRSGSLSTISNNTTINIDNYLTSSLGGQSNIIKGWWDNPTPAGPQSNINNYTGSVTINGSNNTVSMPQIRATGVGGSTDMQGYISGSDNTIATNAGGIYLNTGSLLFPKTTNNYVGATSNIRMTFTTSSLAGGHPTINNNTLYAGALVINSNSGSIQTVAGNLFNGGNITSTQNFVTNTRPSIATNLMNGSSVTLNHISSSINYSNNISNAPVTVNNNLSSSIALNTLTVSNNTFLGGSSNNFHQIYASGSQSSNITRTIADNLIGGRSTFVTSSFVGSNNSNLLSSLIYGQALFVSGNHPTTNGGSAFLGRYNDTTSGLNSVQDIVFAVGTGTGNLARKTGLYVTSGSLVGVSGSMLVQGNTSIQGLTNVLTVTGSATIEHSIAGQPALTVIAQGTGQPALTISGSLNVTGSGDHNIVGNSTTITGSVRLSNVMNLQPLDPLPAGNIGDLAVSSSNQLYFYNGAWTLVV